MRDEPGVSSRHPANFFVAQPAADFRHRLGTDSSCHNLLLFTASKVKNRRHRAPAGSRIGAYAWGEHAMTKISRREFFETAGAGGFEKFRSEEHTSELQSLTNLVCRLLLEKKNSKNGTANTS